MSETKDNPIISSDNTYDLHDTYTFACKYIEKDLTIIPIKPLSKITSLFEWKKYQRKKPDRSEIDLWFKDRTPNQTGISIVLKDGLIGIDFDEPKLMPFVLGDKDPREYTWVAQSNKGVHIYIRAPKILNNIEIPNVVELKAKNKYLIAPPSIHPEGTQYIWLSDITKTPIYELSNSATVDLINRMSFLKKHWKFISILKSLWTKGNRNQVALFTAGALRKAGWNKNEAENLLWILCLLTDDNEEVNRLDCIETTWNKEKLIEVAGISKLEEMLGEDSIEAKRYLEKVLKYRRQQKDRIKDIDIIHWLEDNGTFFINEQHEYFYKNSETVLIDSIYFDKIVREFYEETTGKLLAADKLKRIKDSAKTRALDNRFKTFNRIGRTDGHIYYDLGRNGIVEVSKSGWKVLDKEPDNIFFQRYKHHLDQAKPEYDPSWNVDEFLKSIVKLDKTDYNLFKVWLISCFIPDFDHALLNLFGSEGSGKTKILEFVRKVIDPSPVLTSSLPQKVRDRNLNYFHNYICCFDNLSFINSKKNPDIANEFARAITGQGTLERALFTNDEEKLYKRKTILCINGINQLVKNPDLADRTITFELERIYNPIQNSVLEEKIKSNLPKLLGYIFTVLQKTLKNDLNTTTQGVNFSRLADFCAWGCVISELTGWNKEEFLTTYKNKVISLKINLADDDDLIQAIVEFVKDIKYIPQSQSSNDTPLDEKKWCGTSKELLKILKSDYNIEHIKSGAALTRKLNKFKVILKEFNINYNSKLNGKNRKRIICLESIPSKGDHFQNKSDHLPNDSGDRIDHFRSLAKTTSVIARSQKSCTFTEKNKNDRSSLIVNSENYPKSIKNTDFSDHAITNSDFASDHPENKVIHAITNKIPSTPSEVIQCIKYTPPPSRVDQLLFLKRCDRIIQEEYKKQGGKSLKEFIQSMYEKHFKNKNMTLDYCEQRVKEVLNRSPSQSKSTKSTTRERPKVDVLLPFKSTGRNLLSKSAYIIELLEIGFTKEKAKEMLKEGLKEGKIEEQSDGYLYYYTPL